MRSARRKREGIVTYLRDGGVRARPLRPDIISHARWLDLADRDAGFDTIVTLNYWVTRDLACQHRPDRTFAARVVAGAANLVSANPYPAPGEQCLRCTGMGCRPDLKPVQPVGAPRLPQMTPVDS